MPEVDPRGEARTFYKPEVTPVSQAAKASYFGRVYLDWAVFPVVETQLLEGDPEGLSGEFPGFTVCVPRTHRAGWIRPAQSGLASRGAGDEFRSARGAGRIEVTLSRRCRGGDKRLSPQRHGGHEGISAGSFRVSGCGCWADVELSSTATSVSCMASCFAPRDNRP